MDSVLREKIVSLATRFADEVIAAIDASLMAHFAGSPDLGPVAGRAAPAGRGRSGGRRSAGELDKVADRVIGALRGHDDGIRAEDLRARLGISRSEIVRPLARLLESGRIRKTGEKRNTIYFPVDGGGGAAGARGRRGRRGRAGKKDGAAGAA